MDITPELLAGLGGLALSFGFSYIPKLREKFAGMSDVYKSLIMAGCIVLVAVLIAVVSCTNLWIIITCEKVGLVNLAKLVLITLVSNQGAFSISPQPKSVKEAKALGKYARGETK